MQKKNYKSKNQPDDIFNYCLKSVSNIFGNIEHHTTRKIIWTSEKENVLFKCVLLLRKLKEGTKIELTVDTEKGNKLDEKKMIKTFYDELFSNKIHVYSNRPKQNSNKGFDFYSQSMSWKAIAVVAFVIFTFYHLFLKESTKSNLNFNEHTSYVTKSGYYGTYTKEDLNKLIRYIGNNDQFAINKLIKNGRVISIPQNAEAILIKSNFGTVKIRLKGNTTEFWIVIEAISKE